MIVTVCSSACACSPSFAMCLCSCLCMAQAGTVMWCAGMSGSSDPYVSDSNNVEFP